MMCLAERVATGSRPRVLEDGPDTLNSDEDANEDVEADKELNMYAPGVDPTAGPTVISSAYAARQRAIAQAVSSQMSTPRTTTDSDAGNSIVSSPQPSRQPTPLNSDDDEFMTEDQKRAANHGKKKSLAKSIPRCPSAPGTALSKKKAEVGNPGTRSRAVPEPPMPDPEERIRKARQDERDFLEMLDNPRPVVSPSSSYVGDSKAVPPPSGTRRPTKRSKGSTSKERTGESSGKGHTPNGNPTTCEQSWRLAIRGRLRVNGYVCCKWQPFQNLSRNLFPPRRFSPPGNSAAFNGTARQPSPDMGT
jgi:hypothetical protein